MIQPNLDVRFLNYEPLSAKETDLYKTFIFLYDKKVIVKQIRMSEFKTIFHSYNNFLVQKKKEIADIDNRGQ